MKKSIISQSKLSLAIILIFAFSLLANERAYSFSKEQLRYRIEKFYPLKDVTDYKYAKIKKLVKKELDKKALTEAKALYESDPRDLKAGYVYQAVRSYYLIKKNWRLLTDLPSPLLVFNAWLAFSQKSYAEAYNLAEKCYKKYYDEAVRQQSLLSFPPPESQRRFYWALNDVATSMYIMSVCLIKIKKYQEAYILLKRIKQEFPYAYCYDYSNNKFWKPADSASKKMNMLLANGKAKDVPVPSSSRTTQTASVEKPEIKKPEENTFSSNKNTVIAPPKEDKKISSKTPVKVAQIKQNENADNTIEIVKNPEKISTTYQPEENTIETNKNSELPPDEAEEENIEENSPELPPDEIEEQPQEQEEEQQNVISDSNTNKTVPEKVKKQVESEKKDINISSAEKPEKTKTAEKKSEENEKEKGKPEVRTIITSNVHKNLKQILVFVKKGITLKWTGIQNENGKYEVIEKRKGYMKKKLEFNNLEEFYEYAKSLGFETNK